LETILASLLRMYPDAPVAAHSPVGVMLAMPDSVRLERNPIQNARTGLDLIILDEDVLKGWERMLVQGAARYPVHPTGRPDLTGTVYALDLREIHGVIVTVEVFAPGDAPAVTAVRPEIPDVAPRFASLSKDERGLIVKIDDAMTKILGWSAEEMVGHRSTEFIHPDDQALAIDNWMEMLAAPGPGRRVRLRHRRRDESWVWFEATNHNLLEDPDQRCVVSEMVDISDEMAAHEELKAREQLLDGLAEAIPVGLFQVDAGRRIVYTNDRLHKILGVERAETVEAQLDTVTDADRQALDEALDDVLGEGVPTDIEVELHVPPKRELRFCTISLRALSQEDGTIYGAIACVADVTDSTRMREELKRRATFDELTACYNRASIMLALEADIARDEPHAERAVVFVDLDRFKRVNDLHSHAVGDELLRTVAQRLQEVLRGEDLVGRIGGDEFLVVCPDIGGPEQAIKLAERLAQAQREEVSTTNGPIVAQFSIGVAWSGGADVRADALVAQADSAMYESKREGAGRPKLAVGAEASSPIAT
jgi:diguanylate cyclase (GGDEF)-like protein/PAS domain S-box-containing protein